MIRAIIFALSFAVSASAVKAASVEEKNLVSGKAKIDPEKGYIFQRYAYRFNGVFLRVPDAVTQAEYQKDWDEAFAKAQADYAKKLNRWKSDVELAKRTRQKLPKAPVEPTRESFAIGPIELRDMVFFGPMFVFSKGKNTAGQDQFSYLDAVKPGTYVWYGPIYFDPNAGYVGSCVCMGTVKFEVKAGTITDLGNSLLAMPDPSLGTDAMIEDARRQAEEKAVRTGKPVEPVLLPRAEVSFGLPESLKAWPAQQAELSASGKMNNFFGLQISRVMPIPGVLTYRRDTIVDGRTGLDVPSPPIRSRAKPKQ